MTDCRSNQLEFASCQGRKVQADFEGGEVSSDGGLLLLREVDRQIKVLRRAAALLPDRRQAGKVRHSTEAMLRQRVFALAQGYEDLNDHEQLRHDPLLQTAAGRSSALASAPTLCRMENEADRHSAMALNNLLVDLFIESHRSAPEEVVLDFDATDDPVHGRQEGRFFHGYYDRYCFLPLDVFCGSQPLFAWLRPSNIDEARGAWAVRRWLAKRLREAWPEVRIIWRADSGFCRWRMLQWSERHGVDYIVGLARNARVTRLAASLMEEASSEWERSGQKQRKFDWIEYGARPWGRARSVIAKAEYSEKGSNPRFVVTSLEGDAQLLYDDTYCARGDMENRIKEQQLGLFADRTSCHAWWPNQLRLLLSTLAYVLIDALRRLALHGTDWARRQATTLRACLLKIGAVIVRNTRRVVVHLSSSWPGRERFLLAHARLRSG
ncbi:MAG: IS1380 family transposase [Akkermansiaceae bacterium]|nr:IS1380 family transposase [Akkermansiaceae bacterium]